MIHQSGRANLNLKSAHRKALMRNQMISLINNGILQTTTARVKEVRRLIERLVTVVKRGDGLAFNTIRRVKQEIPYCDKAVYKLIKEIAPRYTTRPGGYTRIYYLGRRPSDTAQISRLEWV